jgi:hypothetical protein
MNHSTVAASLLALRPQAPGYYTLFGWIWVEGLEALAIADWRLPIGDCRLAIDDWPRSSSIGNFKSSGISWRALFPLYLMRKN